MSRAKTLYLAVMPKCRRPKAVPPSSAGWYEQNAAKFYVAFNMTAEQARAAIKDGGLKPRTINGMRVASSDPSAMPEEDARRAAMREFDRMLLALREIEGAGGQQHFLLVVGHVLYTRERSWSEQREVWGWHKVGREGWTYVEFPATTRELRLSFQPASWALYSQQEDVCRTSGMPTAGYVGLALAGVQLDTDDEYFRCRGRTLGGVWFNVKRLAGGRV